MRVKFIQNIKHMKREPKQLKPKLEKKPPARGGSREGKLYVDLTSTPRGH